jgi:MFS family permease
MTSVVTSAVVIGQLFGALFAGLISNTIGRKRSLVLVSFGFVYALAPETRGQPLEAIRTYWYNGGRWPEETST